MTLSPSELRTLTRRYQSRLEAISTRTIQFADAAWAQIAGLTDDDLAQFIAAMEAPAAAAKRAAIATSTAYTSLVLGAAPPAVTAADVPTAYNALSAFLAGRKALGDGQAIEEAMRIAQNQGQAASRNLTISTARRTGDVVVERSNVTVTGWVRIAEAKACPWCQNLDGTTWDTSERGDFGHDRCNCTVSPVPA